MRVLLQREWHIKCQGAIQWLYPLVLFLLIMTLFPLAIGAEPTILLRLATSAVWIAVRLALHWLFSAALVAILSFLAIPLFGLPVGDMLMLFASIMVGSPMLLMLSAIASSLTLTLKNGAALVPLIALPMQLPVLIFATGAVDLYATGLNGLPILAMLGAGSILAVMITPFVIAGILKMAWAT